MKLILGKALDLFRRLIMGALSHAFSGAFVIAIGAVLWFVILKVSEYYMLFSSWTNGNRYLHLVPPAIALMGMLFLASLVFIAIKKFMKSLTVSKLYSAKVIIRYDREGDPDSHQDYAVMGKKTYKGKVYLNCVQIFHMFPPNGKHWAVWEELDGKRFEYTGETVLEYAKHVGTVYVGTYKVEG